jgi:glycosyltransferase involved in cell wall biosynthesis
MPQFSVCIPAYNDIDAFARCLASVLRQEGISLECVVSDDSTTDQIGAYTARLNDGRIVYSRNRERLGPVKNWNRSIDLATGKYITLLHQDDWYRTQDTLRKIYELFHNEKADALFCGRALYRDGQCLGEYLMTSRKVMAFQAGFPGRTLVVNTLGQPSVAFFHRRHANLQYDAALVYFPDTEYFSQLIGAAENIAVCVEPLVAVSRSETQLSASCLARLDTLVPQLAYAMSKHRATEAQRGLALARFFAGNLLHLRVKTFISALRQSRELFSVIAFWFFVLSLPLFLSHMLYRAAYRRVAGKPWG